VLASLPIHGCDVDDEPLAIDGLEAQCERVEDLEIVGTAADGEAALGLLEAQRPARSFRGGIADSTASDTPGYRRNTMGPRAAWAHDLLQQFNCEDSRAVPHPFSAATP